jgi:two-component system, NtrC family, C4-dicarboxylate transport sensor histidine kinase DctB
MKKDDATTDHPPGNNGEGVLREKEALSQQVKQLIRAEGKLYEYQEELDNQLKEYKELYRLNRRLNEVLEVAQIFEETVSYVIEKLGYERVVFFRKVEETGHYCVCALEGYYDDKEKNHVLNMVIERDAPCLSPLFAGKELVVCGAEECDPHLAACRQKLLLNEYFIYRLGFPSDPHSILIVGNTLENGSFYRRVDTSAGTLLSMGNLVGLVSSVIESRMFLEKVTIAREQERRAEAKYRNIFENATEGIFQRTLDGRYMDANPALAQMLGYDSPRELMEQVTNIGQQLYVEPRYHDDLMRLIETADKVDGFETRMYRKDRSIIWVCIGLRTVRDSEGNRLFFEGMLEEITNRKLAEQALRESEQQYRQLSEALEQRVKEAVKELREKDRILIVQGRQAVMGEMISNIAHQWRQPLNMLGLLIQELLITWKRGEMTDEAFRGNLERSLEIIRGVSRTIDDFRYFFRPDEGRVEFRVIEPIEKALSLLSGSFSIHGIDAGIEAAGDPVITGFLNEFVQVILNILINARDALIARGPQNPSIKVRIFTEDGRTVISIADNAGGIPDEIMERIFEPYFTTKGPQQGTGIGLFMSRTIIEKSMNGKLFARNEGDGAEFRIEI